MHVLYTSTDLIICFVFCSVCKKKISLFPCKCAYGSYRNSSCMYCLQWSSIGFGHVLLCNMHTNLFFPVGVSGLLQDPTAFSTWSHPHMGIQSHSYAYMEQLLSLEKQVRITHPLSWVVLPSPIRVNLMASDLLKHPDKRFTDYNLRGLTNGFRIGFSRHTNLRSLPRNHPSSLANPIVVTNRRSFKRPLSRPPSLVSASHPYWLGSQVPLFDAMPHDSRPVCSSGPQCK